MMAAATQGNKLPKGIARFFKPILKDEYLASVSVKKEPTPDEVNATHLRISGAAHLREILDLPPDSVKKGPGRPSKVEEAKNALLQIALKAIPVDCAGGTLEEIRAWWESFYPTHEQAEKHVATVTARSAAAPGGGDGTGGALASDAAADATGSGHGTRYSSHQKASIYQACHKWAKDGSHTGFYEATVVRNRYSDFTGIVIPERTIGRWIKEEMNAYAAGRGIRSLAAGKALLASAEVTLRIAKDEPMPKIGGRPAQFPKELYGELQRRCTALMGDFPGFGPAQVVMLAGELLKRRAASLALTLHWQPLEQWGYWFIKHVMRLSYRRNTSTKPLLSAAALTKQQDVHKHNLKRIALALHDGLALKYIIALDEFGQFFFPTSDWRYAPTGERQVFNGFKDDKRQYTADIGEALAAARSCPLPASVHVSNCMHGVIVVVLASSIRSRAFHSLTRVASVSFCPIAPLRAVHTAAGTILCWQMIFGGKTTASLPVKAVLDKYANLLACITANHWCNEDTKLQLMRYIYKLVVEQYKAEGKSAADVRCIVILDCWPVNMKKSFRDAIARDCPGMELLYIPAGATGEYQINDTHLHRPFKAEMRRLANLWLYARYEAFEKLLELPADDPKHVTEDDLPALLNALMRIGVLRNMAPDWMWAAMRVLTDVREDSEWWSSAPRCRASSPSLAAVTVLSPPCFRPLPSAVAACRAERHRQGLEAAVPGPRRGRAGRSAGRA